MSSSIASDSPSPPSSDWSPPPSVSTATQKRLKNGSILEERSQTSLSPSPPLDTGGSLFWNASLLYYTGQSSPKVKQHHLRSSVSMSDMNRPISPAAKLLIKSPSNDSGTGTYSSATTVVSSNGEENMSPLRRRHLSCGSSSASSSSMGSLKKGKLSNSMRMMKAISRRPSLAAFMERTQSLGRNSKNKSVTPGESNFEEISSTSNSTETEATTTPSSSSGLSSTAKVFRDSFKAAKNLLPSSTKGTNPSGPSATGLKKEVYLSSSSLHSDSNGSASTINYSAPNTPNVSDKSYVSSESERKGSVSDLVSGAVNPKGSKVTPTFATVTAVVKTKSSSSSAATSSSKMASSDGTKDAGSSKSISGKLKKSKEKDKDPEKAGAPKKVSLVKSLSRMRIGSWTKEKRDKDLSPDFKTVSDSRNPPLQEIVELENEPRVRTSKSTKNQLTTSYPERDREFNEMEVSEEALEVARSEKLSKESETNKSKSQISSQSKPWVITDEDKKSSKSKDKGSTKKAESSSTPTGPLMEDHKNKLSLEVFPPLPSSVKKGKAKEGNGKKSLETENKPKGKLLETRLDLEAEEDHISNQKSKCTTRTKNDEPDSGRSSDYLQGDQALTRLDNPSLKDGEEFRNNPETVTDGEGAVIGKTPNVTSGPDAKDLRRKALGAEGAEEADEDTYCTESFRQLKPFNFDLEPIEEGKRERLYKVLVVGELGAGKTSIIKRYVHQFFSQHYRATIGVDFALKVLRWDPDTVVRLQLWDIAGQERFGSMTRVYYKEAVGAFVVFDVTRGATLEAVPKWKADLDSKVALPDGRPIPTVLLANKSDQPKEGIAANREKMNDFCQQQGFAAWFETSAKDNINIDESANFLVSKILEMDRWSQEPLAPDPDKVDLSANGKTKPNAPSNCSC